MGKLDRTEILELTRWNTPSIYNGWEKLTKRDRLECNQNYEEITDFSPQLGTVGGYAITMQYACSDKEAQAANSGNMAEFLRYVASVPGPKIVLTQDLDAPNFKGAYFGEVMSYVYAALDVVGGISDGNVRDVSESEKVGFKMLGRRYCVGHAYCYAVRWGVSLNMYGTTINPGDLVFADKYGFLAIPEYEQEGLLDATRFLDTSELISVTRAAADAKQKGISESVEDIIRSYAVQRERNAGYKLPR